MRLLTLASKYSAYIAQQYATNPALAGRPYDQQLQALLGESFGAPENRTHSFSQRGYQTSHVLANVEPLQKQWALERSVAYTPESWLTDIAAAQVRDFQPDILFVTDYGLFTAPFLRRLKQEVKTVRLTIGWCGAPFSNPDVFREFDRILSNIPELVRRFNRDGHQARHVNHAFDARILKKLPHTLAPRIPFTFVGSVIKSAAFHESREKLLLALLECTPLQIWGQIRRPSWRKMAGLKVRQAAYTARSLARRAGMPEGVVRRLPLAGRSGGPERRPALKGYVDPLIWRRARSPLFGLAMFQKLRDSRVSLNTHIDLSADSASNMRLYEATGVGSCLLTDWKENLSTLFDPEREVVSYRSEAECIEKVRYLLSHEDERKAIAAAGQRRVLRDHTIENRVDQIEEIIHKALGASRGTA